MPRPPRHIDTFLRTGVRRRPRVRSPKLLNPAAIRCMVKASRPCTNYKAEGIDCQLDWRINPDLCTACNEKSGCAKGDSPVLRSCSRPDYS